MAVVGRRPASVWVGVASCLCVGAVCALAIGSPPQTLFVVDGPPSTFNSFLDGLERQLRHNVTITDKPIELISYGERVFDNVMVFGPNANSYSVNELLDFVDLGGNVLAASGMPGKPLQNLSNKCGFDFDENTAFVTSDANPLDILHKTVAVHSKNNIRIDLNGRPIAFRGIGQAISVLSSTAKSFPVLTGDVSTYSFNERERTVESAGQELVLVGAFQAFNNARITITGSSDMFSDELYAIPSCANEEFTLRLAAWTFGQTGQLSASNVHHHRIDHAGDLIPPKQYTVNDTVAYHVDIAQYNGFTDQWEPFNTDDMQLEFVMMDPFLRVPLQASSGHFSAIFTVPDQYGVFKFRIEYSRSGLSRLSLSTVVPVHPKRHDEFERFVDSAFPYYVAQFSMMIGFVIFSGVYLYHKDE